MAIGLGFDAVNSEFNRRTLSRVLSQPIYRDALLLGKFLAGLATLAVALVALWLIVLGAGILMLGLPPREVEVARGIGFLVVAIAYGGVWLAVSLLFSVIFRSTATSALCALGLWLFFFILWPQLASAIFTALAPSEIRNHRRVCRRPVVRPGPDAAVARHAVHRGCTGPAQSRDPNAWGRCCRSRCAAPSPARRCRSSKACC